MISLQCRYPETCGWANKSKNQIAQVCVTSLATSCILMQDTHWLKGSGISRNRAKTVRSRVCRRKQQTTEKKRPEIHQTGQWGGLFSSIKPRKRFSVSAMASHCAVCGKGGSLKDCVAVPGVLWEAISSQVLWFPSCKWRTTEYFITVCRR